MLTEKEIEVLRLRRKNLTQKQVAEKLGISQASVSTFEKKALKKIKDSEATILFAKEHGLEVPK